MPVTSAIPIPLIAAGGIATGRGMLAAMVLGADGVQIGSAFAVAEESSAHITFKEKVIALDEGDTMLCLKKLAPVRLIKNPLYEKIAEAEKNIEKNLVDQENKNKEIDTQKTVVEKVVEKLNNLGKKD